MESKQTKIILIGCKQPPCYSNANKEILGKKASSVCNELCCSTSDNPPDQRNVPDFEQRAITCCVIFLPKET